MATSNNPRKFSEKIALHNQKQAEETAAFEEVMKDLSLTRAARLQLQKSQYLQLGPSRGQYYGGSLPNVNQIGSSSMDLSFQVSPHSPGSAPLLGDTPGLPVSVVSHSGASSSYRLQGQLVGSQKMGHVP